MEDIRGINRGGLALFKDVVSITGKQQSWRTLASSEIQSNRTNIL
jgi:hypothetical protein